MFRTIIYEKVLKTESEPIMINGAAPSLRIPYRVQYIVIHTVVPNMLKNKIVNKMEGYSVLALPFSSFYHSMQTFTKIIENLQKEKCCSFTFKFAN
jgi:hypothetical protein